MNRILILILVAALTLGLVFIVKKPEIVEKVWLWLVGFAGIIIRVFQEVADWIKKRLDGDKKQGESANDEKGSEHSIVPNDNFHGLTLSLFRISEDGQTTVGMLYLNETFFCYTLEDSDPVEQQKQEQQVPPGSYEIGFNSDDSDLTKKYQNLYPDWFTRHIELKNVPGFTEVLLLNENSGIPGRACIMVSNTLNGESGDALLHGSRVTYKNLYIRLRSSLEESIPVRILVKAQSSNQNLKAS